MSSVLFLVQDVHDDPESFYNIALLPFIWGGGGVVRELLLHGHFVSMMIYGVCYYLMPNRTWCLDSSIPGMIGRPNH